MIFRFAQGSIHRDGVFNGDPHPGNYRFHDDGTVTFLDFGLVKRWAEASSERSSRASTRCSTANPWCVARMDAVGFLPADHGLDPCSSSSTSARPTSRI